MKQMAAILILLLCSNFLFSVTKADVDELIDFSLSLKDFDPVSSSARQVLTSKAVFLDGSLALVQPWRTLFFLYKTSDFINPEKFLRSLQARALPLTDFIYTGLSLELRKKVDAWESGTALLKPLLRELNRFMQKNLFTPDGPLPEELKVLAGVTPAEPDEIAFINRLFIDAAFKDSITPVTLTLEIVKGEWFGYDSVKQFKAAVQFRGAECFKLFKRRKVNKAWEGKISLNAGVLIVARPLKLTEIRPGEKVWLFEGFYIKEMK